MNEGLFLTLELSIPQWIAFISFAIATVAFFVWVWVLSRKKH